MPSPLAGALLSVISGKGPGPWPRRISLFFMLLHGAVSLGLFARFRAAGLSPLTGWLLEIRSEWFPEAGITFHLALDGLSLVLILLTSLMGIMAILSSRTEIREHTGFFYCNLLIALGGITGVFLAIDLFLFYFFWELMIVPVYFLIALWGHEQRAYGSVKFFIFTQSGGLLMLAAMVGLVFVNGETSGDYSFDFPHLLGTSMSAGTGLLLFSGFLAAFLVKLPALPFHTWLADAHTQAPTGGSVILAGLLLKTGAYGLIRFAVPLFPDAAATCAPAGLVIGAAGILYGAVLAFGQTDLKRLIAWSSVSHMGFVILAVSAWNGIALQGAVIQMVSHGVSTGALFILAGSLQERTRTRDMRRMGGLWSRVPRMGGMVLLFSLASLGLPGLGNFIGEFLILLGVYNVSGTAAVFAASGFIAAALYALVLVWRAFFGSERERWDIPDLSLRELAPLAILAAIIVWIGLAPRMLIETAGPGIIRSVHAGSVQTGERRAGTNPADTARASYEF